jgi:endonuclease-8
MELSGGLTLLTHMLMNGSWHIYRPGERWRRPRDHMRIVVETPRITAVAFDVQTAEFHTAASLERRRGFRDLGPSAAHDDFDPALAASNLRSRPELEAADALLRQSLLAGVGNVFKCEILFACGVHPFRTVRSLAESEVDALVEASRRFLRASTRGGVRNTTGRADPSARLWVYGRGGEPCRRCGATIVSAKRGADARITYWCPACQPAGA